MKAMFLAIGRGLRNHLIAIFALAGVGVVGLIFVTGGVYVASHYDGFCTSCHYMTPYHKNQEMASHSDLSCITCHPFRPVINAVSFVRYVTNTYDPRPRAEVPNGICLQSSCHTSDSLDGKRIVDKKIHFNHTPHLTQLRRGKRLQCTSCHSGVMQGTLFTTAKETCFLCHFKGVGEAQAIGGCSNCHGTPGETVQHGGFVFSHETYLKVGVSCQQCHLKVAEGTGDVPQERCLSCHVGRLAEFGNTELIHKTHLVEHKVDCFKCHEKIRHGEIQMIRALEPTCENCHKGLHSPQKEMYIGAGGEGVADMPSRMFAAQVACDGCHTRATHLGTPKFDETSLEAQRQSCVACHGPGYDLMLDDWMREMKRLATLLQQEVEHAEGALKRIEKTNADVTPARVLIEKARENYDFLKFGRGVHNVEYALNLTKAATGFLDRAMGQMDRTYQVPNRPKLVTSPDGYCSTLCHVRIGLPEETPFDHMIFPHQLHAEGLEVACTKCHSPEKHKMRVITRTECMACHHKTQDISCGHCHPAQEALYTGKTTAWGVSGDPDVMAQGEVECTGCHDLSKPHVVADIQELCVACHEAGYDGMLGEWINEGQASLGRVLVLIKDVKQGIETSKKRGKNTDEAEALFEKSKRVAELIDKGKSTHNYALSGDLLNKAEADLKQALALVQGLPPSP